MAGEGELLVRGDCGPECDLRLRPRTEDEVTPGKWMAKRPAKKPEKQLDLPPTSAPPPTTKVLPMRLQVGDRDKMVYARVQYIGQPATKVLWVWGAHERVAVRREGAP
jgi:hypothetical protein